jgi:DNA ligase-1
MKQFAELFRRLDGTTRTSEKTSLLTDYFRAVPAADAAWALYFLTGRKLKRLIKTRALREWAAEAAALPLWLVERSYEAVGDLGETLAWILPPPEGERDESLVEVVEKQILPLVDAEPAVQRRLVREAWRLFDDHERLVYHKLITGEFRVGVAQTLVVRALAAAAEVSAPLMAHRLAGDWQPTPEQYQKFISGDLGDDPVRPYPFFLAYALDEPVQQLGQPHEWQAEWKWDGIRGQALRRADAAGNSVTALWSRGEELVTERFPELHPLLDALPTGTVLDGEILAWRDDRPLPFAALQKRIGRKSITPRNLKEAPVAFLAYDLLEADGVDVRERPLSERRQRLEQIVGQVAQPRLRLSPVVGFQSWDELERQYQRARAEQVEGLMIKRLDAPYGVGRRRGPWWKWKAEPYSIDAVLMYAQAGHGKRAGLYTDYTFGVWDMRRLVPVAKAYSGLTDEEIRQVDAFIRAHTVDKFGPVREVEPRLVFELHFEGIQISSRHRAGIAVRFPRMHRWRHDKPPAEADSLETLVQLAGIGRDDLHPRVSRQSTLFDLDDEAEDETAAEARPS